MSNSFIEKYIDLAIISSQNYFIDNYDTWRFGESKPLDKSVSNILKNMYYSFFRKINIINKNDLKNIVNDALAYVAPYINEFEWLYQSLADDESRTLLINLQLYRALGHKRIKLPLNCNDYWDKLSSVEKLMANSETVELGCMGWFSYKMRLNNLVGYPLEIFIRPPGVVHQLLLQQYRCEVSGISVEVHEGDVVLDGGGCYGETALYFSQKSGNSGRIFSFEFIPENLSIFQKNMELNPELAQRVTVINQPLWEHSGEKLFIEGNGPGSRVSPVKNNDSAKQIETISIDDFVCQKCLDRIDFIKMDIEGAELMALKGAEVSIRKFRPKMAISIYHKLEDFWTIPQFLASLNMEYKFVIRHFTIHQEETVLFVF